MFAANQIKQNGQKRAKKAKGRILVVEDSPTQALELSEILRSDGLEVENASTGEAALDFFKRSNFDVVVSDILMPGMSGYELCRSIKARHAD
jgi:CheY-like chemotaxis protein